MEGLILFALIGYGLYRWARGEGRRGTSRRQEAGRASPGARRPPTSSAPAGSSGAGGRVATWRGAWPTVDDLDARRLVRDVAYLRQRLGGEWNGALEPFTVDPRDAVDVNRAVNRIARHAGIRDVRFIVAIGRLEPDYGGRVELTNRHDEVFIDVATAAAAFHASLLAVLAHEVTHKVLFDRRILPEGRAPQEYEVLTDVAAIYLGFGKILLNGYQYAVTRRTSVDGDIEKARYRFGYLNAQQVAFVHAYVHHVRKALPSDWHARLSPFATRNLVTVFDNPNLLRYFQAPRETFRPEPDPRRRSTSKPASEKADSAPRRSAERPVGSRRPSKVPSADRAEEEVRRLRKELLSLVYGDERQLTRLVAYERARQESLEASYRAAIVRLVRDRSRSGGR